MGVASVSNRIGSELSSRVLTRDAVSTPHFGYAFTKRALDILGALLLLVVLAPLFLVLAVTIKLSSRGPIFFRQERIGLYRKPFRALKFRSMCQDAEEQLASLQALAENGELRTVDAPAFKSADDPRVTRVGRFMRRFSLDELPQIFNVLGGSMSFVGPRPLVALEANALSPETDMRHCVKPGITCIWQVSGRSDVSYEQRLAMDVDYVERRSLWLDIVLILRTPAAVFSGRGAY